MLYNHRHQHLSNNKANTLRLIEKKTFPKIKQPSDTAAEDCKHTHRYFQLHIVRTFRDFPKMKVLSKPLSSPGRTEKLPTPLMVRFLRSNVGSRSRGRARSSPMFYNLRSKKNVIESTQLEPSSPTVTCIGQVRVRRSKGKKRGGASVNQRRGWWWWRMRRSFSCRKVSLRLIWNKKTLRKVCCIRWGLFFRSGYCKKVDASEDSFRVCNHGTNGKNGSFAVDNCGDNNNRVCSGSGSSVSDDEFRRSCSHNMENVLEISSKIALLDDEHSSCNSNPPKNALLLTRCRSAPYRSSSLAGKFWNSPLIETKGDGKDDHEADPSDGKSEEFQNPSREDSEEDPRISEESSKESMENASVNSKQNEFNSNSIHPLLLTRCKSEPARTGFRLIEP